MRPLDDFDLRGWNRDRSEVSFQVNAEIDTCRKNRQGA